MSAGRDMAFHAERTALGGLQEGSCLGNERIVAAAGKIEGRIGDLRFILGSADLIEQMKQIVLASGKRLWLAQLLRNQRSKRANKISGPLDLKRAGQTDTRCV